MGATMVGHVALERYQELVERTRQLVETVGRAQFEIGDNALEIAPMQERGGSHPLAGIDDTYDISEILATFADDVGLAAATIKEYRWTSSRWPAQYRQVGVSHKVHRILAAISDEQARWRQITRPPLDERTGHCRWTPDAASRIVGYQVERPVSVKEKVRAIHDLAGDEEVAATVATDLLRRPAVAHQAMADDTAKHMVNRAQYNQAHQAAEPARRAAAPALRRVEHTLGFIDLVGACAAFVAAGGRIVPALRGRSFTDTERASVHKNLARVRSTADWIETAIDTGDTTLDEGLAALLRDR
ncbi:DUF6192 family protein [Planobispora siamensis]|uniref:RacO protein n=1 Tax=Planobispora siamensis TaxID=936338 RepID=A0A8J3WSI8_9ACTN|nr:DUF6192 family protein [Planobispora siamensis]GIH97966.1 hypothetical protein Psi01_85960 [Planobispora siamensis]